MNGGYFNHPFWKIDPDEQRRKDKAEAKKFFDRQREMLAKAQVKNADGTVVDVKQDPPRS
jgi:hypothetical protein